MPYNDPLDTVFHDTVMDYFSKMGGAGQWMVPNYKDVKRTSIMGHRNGCDIA